MTDSAMQARHADDAVACWYWSCSNTHILCLIMQHAIVYNYSVTCCYTVLHCHLPGHHHVGVIGCILLSLRQRAYLQNSPNFGTCSGSSPCAPALRVGTSQPLVASFGASRGSPMVIAHHLWYKACLNHSQTNFYPHIHGCRYVLQLAPPPMPRPAP